MSTKAAAIAKALADVGLERLEPLLDTVERWDRQLTDDEKQRLAFARVILQKPLWVVVNDALDVLDPESRMRIRALFTGEFADVGIINIGHDQPESGFYVRRLHLVTDPLGPTFSRIASMESLNRPSPRARLSPPNKLRAESGVDFQPAQIRGRDEVAVDVARPAIRPSLLGPRIPDGDSIRRRTRQGQLDHGPGLPAPGLEIGGAEGGRQVAQRDALALPPGVGHRAKQFEDRAVFAQQHPPNGGGELGADPGVGHVADIFRRPQSPQTTSAQPRQPRGLRLASMADSWRKASSYRPKDTNALRLRNSYGV